MYFITYDVQEYDDYCARKNKKDPLGEWLTLNGLRTLRIVMTFAIDVTNADRQIPNWLVTWREEVADQGTDLAVPCSRRSGPRVRSLPSGYRHHAVRPSLGDPVLHDAADPGTGQLG